MIVGEDVAIRGYDHPGARSGLLRSSPGLLPLYRDADNCGSYGFNNRYYSLRIGIEKLDIPLSFSTDFTAAVWSLNLSVSIYKGQSALYVFHFYSPPRI